MLYLVINKKSKKQNSFLSISDNQTNLKIANTFVLYRAQYIAKSIRYLWKKFS